MILHGSPRRVLVLGGGEGATLREVLKYTSVEEAVMVDIDEDVVKVSREHLRFMNEGVFEDKRVKLVIGDALDYVFSTKDRYDVVIADLSDPLEEGPAYKLYTVEFYRRVAEIIGGTGVFVTQATSPTNTPRTHAVIYRTIREVFRYTAYYHVFVPSFEAAWGFVIASNERDPRKLEPEHVDRELHRNNIKTRFYDGEAHKHMFSVPKHLREYIESVDEISTVEKPVYMPA
jgi:spermidine synthase